VLDGILGNDTDLPVTETHGATLVNFALFDLVHPAVVVGAAEDATGIPSKEDPGAPDESVGVRPRRRGAGTTAGIQRCDPTDPSSTVDRRVPLHLVSRAPPEPAGAASVDWSVDEASMSRFRDGRMRPPKHGCVGMFSAAQNCLISTG